MMDLLKEQQALLVTYKVMDTGLITLSNNPVLHGASELITAFRTTMLSLIITSHGQSVPDKWPPCRYRAQHG